MNWRHLRARIYYATEFSRGWVCWMLCVNLPLYRTPRLWLWLLPYAGAYAYFDDPYVASIRQRHLRRLAARA